MLNKNRVVTDGLVAFIPSGECFLEFKEFYKERKKKLNGISCNGFVKISYDPLIEECTQRNNYELVKVSLHEFIDNTGMYLKNLIKYYK